MLSVQLILTFFSMMPDPYANKNNPHVLKQIICSI